MNLVFIDNNCLSITCDLLANPTMPSVPYPKLMDIELSLTKKNITYHRLPKSFKIHVNPLELIKIKDPFSAHKIFLE